MGQNTPRERLHAVDAQVPPDRVLDAHFWLQFGTDPDPSMRDKILFVTLDDVSRVGPATFNVKLVCETLDVSYSLINHHFGSRDELLAEATLLAYAMYVEELWQQAQQAERTPEARLEAWIRASIAWSQRMSGWGAILNYPTAALDVTEFVRERSGDAMREWGILNLARLFTLVSDVRRGSVTPGPELGNIDNSSLLNDREMTELTSSIGWSILGVSVWHAGRHLPTGDIPELAPLDSSLVDSHIESLIRKAKGV